MDGTFVTALKETLAIPELLTPGPGNVVVVPQGWKRLEREHAPDTPVALEVSTLTAVVTYLDKNIDGLDLSALMVHVAGPAEVRVVERVEAEATRFRRKERLSAETDRPVFDFGRFMEAEEFIIKVSCLFEASAARDRLLMLVASIRGNTVQDTVDDGVSQQVTTARGVQLVNRENVPNPFPLRPYRTFVEVAQPESPFLLRLRKTGDDNERGKPACALFECDGGVWKHDATQSVAEWLQKELPAMVVIA